jgi:hypothetical protein
MKKEENLTIRRRLEGIFARLPSELKGQGSDKVIKVIRLKPKQNGGKETVGGALGIGISYCLSECGHGRDLKCQSLT